ncbi:MAG: DNA repair exonuclease [Chloroflexota bacterium]|nr:DNA repair exonuclease [Chloroflexota bacterium]
MPSIEPFRFLHTGDLHLDSPFQGVSAEAPASLLDVLRAATTDAWRNVVRLAIEERVDFAVVAGDVFEGRSPTLLGQTRFRDGLAELAAAGIPSVVVHGNHDPLDGRSWAPSLVFPDACRRFGARGVESQAIVRGGREIARVYGRSYDRPAVTENLVSGFHRDPDVPFAVGLLHANVGDRPGHGNYAPCSIEDLGAAGMDYWALGHIHRPGVISADPLAVYCGIPQGRDPGETGPRGCYLVDVAADGRPAARFVACDVVRWQHLAIGIDQLTDDEQLQRRSLAALAEATEAADGRALVARVHLIGRGGLHASLRRTGYTDDLRALLNEQLPAAPLAWVESIRNETRPAVDLAARRGAPDFIGDFLGTADAARRAERSTDPDEHARWAELLRAAVAPLFDGSPRGRRFLHDARPSDSTLSGELLDAAQALALDTLLGAEEER